MLTQLSIRSFLLIDRLDIDVPPGLLVLSGETGTGKSILLDSLALALGARGEANRVRPGADQASVSLSFSLPDNHPARAALDGLGLADDPSGALILRRVIGKDGRTRAFINDQPVAVHALKRAGDTLFDIHGQFETHGLLNRETHLALLDRFAGLEASVTELGELFTGWRAARTALEAAQDDVQSAARRAEDIRAARDELEKLAPRDGEAQELAGRRARLQQKERVIEALQAAQAGLRQEEGALVKTGTVRRILTRAAEKAPELLHSVLDTLSHAEDQLAEAVNALESLLHKDDFDAAALEAAEERLFALRAAGRKYQCTPEDLPELLEKFRAEARLLEDNSASLQKLEERRDLAFKAWQAKAEFIHAAREKAAKKLESAVAKELPPLKLENARLAIDLEKLAPDHANADGMTRIGFTVSMNPGMAQAPLHKTASGGELARFMLALRLCLSADESATTLVFDEVDSGIGGATAHAVGERLSKLAKNTQTLVITHSPQVAARGDHHWRVEKTVQDGAAATKVTALSGVARQEEIARMLAGNVVTDAARAAARHLLEGASMPSAKKRKAS